VWTNKFKSLLNNFRYKKILKSKLLIIFVFSITLLSVGTLLTIPYAFGLCLENIDWPEARCYTCIDCYPGIEQEKIDWMPYYDYKGSELMELKKLEMIHAIQTHTLPEWIKSTQDTQAHNNVYKYYSFLGEIPNPNSGLTHMIILFIVGIIGAIISGIVFCD